MPRICLVEDDSLCVERGGLSRCSMREQTKEAQSGHALALGILIVKTGEKNSHTQIKQEKSYPA